MRLIDADELKSKHMFYHELDNEMYVTEEGIDDTPTVDAVPVVFCRDCKHSKTDGMDDPAIYCKKWDVWEMPSDFYCKYGGRKGGEEL